MRKTLFVLLAAALVASLASSVMAATWYKVGTSGFTTTASWTYDSQRIKINSIAVDGGGNIYATAVNGNNEGTNAGGLTIFKPNGTKIDVNLNALGYPMGVTRLVKGGDGSIYALQNWREIGWSYNKGENRILKIGADGTVSQIWTPGAPAADGKQIAGMAVGGDGNIYWVMSGTDSYWKYHLLWRYDVSTGVVEEAPINNTNNGWSDGDRLLNFEYVGDGWFNIINSGGQSWSADPISWTTNRVAGTVSAPGWGRDHCTALAYDPVNDKLWMGARGTRDGSDRLILSRWNDFSAVDGKAASQNVWHALGDVDQGAHYWTSGLAVNPLNGDAWMGFGVASPTNQLSGYRGHVVRFDGALGMFDEGAPEIDDFGMASDIAALGFMPNGTALAMVLSPAGTYTLYSTAPVPEPGSLLALGTGLIGLLGIIRRRK